MRMMSFTFVADRNVCPTLHPKRPVGWKGLLPGAVLAGGAKDYEACKVTLRVEKYKGARVARVSVKNAGKKTIRLRAIRWVSDIAVAYAPPVMQFPKKLEPFYFATENFRGDYLGTTTTQGDSYFKPLPHECVTMGFSEDAVFPGLFVGSRREPVGLLCAAASREKFHAVFRLHGGVTPDNANFEIEEIPQGLDALEIAPGETVLGEKMFFDIVPTNDPQLATDRYYAYLGRDGHFERVKDNPLPKQRIWCSWNFGYYDRIDEREILKQLPVIRERFPSVKFVQIDDGYERVYPGGQRASIDMLYGTKRASDPRKFPHGMKWLARQIKAAGLRPAIWLGLWVSDSSELAKDHPEWMLLDDMGRRLSFVNAFGCADGKPHEHLILDPSVSAARAFVESVARTLFCDWGYEGIKLDFFTFAFQIRRARFRAGNRTAPQYATWLIDTLRKYLPADGFVGLGSVAGTGSPFYGGPADYFRNGIDISEGDWRLAKTIALWCVNTNMLLTEKPVLANVDSIGWGPKFTDVEWPTFLNLCALTGGTVEIGGDLTTLDDAKIARMNRTLELSNPTLRFRCLDVPEGKIVDPPALWVAERPGTRLAGIFNWADRSRAVDVSRLSALWPDWRRAMKPAYPGDVLCAHGRAVKLPAHGSILLEG